MSLNEGEGRAELAIERVDGRVGALGMEGSFSNASGVLAIDLSVSEAEDGIAANLLDLPGLPSIALDIQGTGRISDFVADIRLATDGAERLAGQVRLSENEGEQRFDADLGGDIAPVFFPQYRPFFGDAINLQAAGAKRPDGRLVLEELTLRARSVSLRGSATLAPDGIPEAFDLSGQIVDATGAPVLLPLSGSPTRIDAASFDASFAAATGDAWTLVADVTGFDRPEISIDTLSLRGEGTIQQDAAGDQVSADLTFGAEDMRFADAALAEALGANLDGHVLMDWRRGDPVIFEGFELRGAGMDLAGSGTVEVEDGLRVEGQVQGNIADL